MSYVTGLVLTCATFEDEGDEDLPPQVVALNAFLEERGLAPLKDMAELTVGSKHPQIFVLAGGYNYFPVEEFAALFMAQKWRGPGEAVLMLNTEQEDISRIWRADVGELDPLMNNLTPKERA